MGCFHFVLNHSGHSNMQGVRNQIAKFGKIINAIETSDGAGVRLKRSLGTNALPILDPFLMLDEFGSEEGADYIAGFPNHPHRGFETVTYMLNGKMQHKDNKGNEGVIETGGVQWMTAGKGVIHSEMPLQKEGLMRGFQLWINLPSSKKMCEPRYQDIRPEDVPEIKYIMEILLKLFLVLLKMIMIIMFLDVLKILLLILFFWMFILKKEILFHIVYLLIMLDLFILMKVLFQCKEQYYILINLVH